MRYNYYATQMSREKSCNLVSVNQHQDLALCFTEQKKSSEVIQAVGRYYLIENINSAEVAFVIKENKRSKGMAKTLLAEIVAIAKTRHLNKLLACVRRDNAPMLKVFEKAGFVRQYGEDIDEVSLELSLFE